MWWTIICVDRKVKFSDKVIFCIEENNNLSYACTVVLSNPWLNACEEERSGTRVEYLLIIVKYLFSTSVLWKVLVHNYFLTVLIWKCFSNFHASNTSLWTLPTQLYNFIWRERLSFLVGHAINTNQLLLLVKLYTEMLILPLKCVSFNKRKMHERKNSTYSNNTKLRNLKIRFDIVALY